MGEITVQAPAKSTGYFELKNRDGKLIYAERSDYSRIWKGFHSWRAQYLTELNPERTARIRDSLKTLKGFREGKTYPWNIAFYLYNKYFRR